MLVTTARGAAVGVLVAVFAPVGSTAPVPAASAKAEKERAAVAAKLHGTWRGGPCEGEITFRPDRTYSWTGIGPGGECHEGVWALRGDPARPTIVMEYKKADAEECEGKTLELQLVRVGDTEFQFGCPRTSNPKTFERVKKTSPAP